jgi:hypothetical protein
VGQTVLFNFSFKKAFEFKIGTRFTDQTHSQTSSFLDFLYLNTSKMKNKEEPFLDDSFSPSPQPPFPHFFVLKKWANFFRDDAQEIIAYNDWCKKKEGCYPLGKIFGGINPNKKGGHTPCQDFYGRRQYVM